MIKTYRTIVVLGLVTLMGASCATHEKRKPRSAKPAPVQIRHSVATAERSASSSLVERGVAAMMAGNSDEARDLFQEAIQIDPNNGEIYYHWAVLEEKEGDREQARQLWIKADAFLGDEPEWKMRLEKLGERVGN